MTNSIFTVFMWIISVKLSHYKSRKLPLNWKVGKNYYWKIIQSIPKIYKIKLLIKLIELIHLKNLYTENDHVSKPMKNICQSN